MRIIDTHTHIYPQKIAEKATQSIGEFYKIKMQQTGTAERLIESGSEIGVQNYIVCSVATTSKQVASINKYILSETQLHKEFYGLITLHPDLTESEIDEQIDFAKKNNFKGIKLHPDFQKFAIDDKSAMPIYERAEGVLPILFHAGDSRYSFSNPNRIAKISKEFSNLKIVAAHFGGYSEWDKVFSLQDCPNVYFDTCSSLEFISSQTANRIISQMGVDRFMFASDFPMWKHKKELLNIENLHLSDEDFEKVMHKNAENFWHI